MAKDASSAKNLFLLEELYPEPRAIFAFNLKSIRDIKDDCLIVLDTNALLSPYGVGKESLKKIQSVYSLLAEQERLIVPAHVVREFAENRPAKLTELHKQLLVRKSAFIQKTTEVREYPLLESMSEYSELLAKEKEIAAKVKELRSEHFAKIEQLIERVREWRWNDPVTTVYGSIFSDKVIYEPTLDREKIEAEAEKRKRYKIPPGYKDYKDNNSDSRNLAGDIIIWFTILELAAKGRDVIFVSSDEKADWWHRSGGEEGTALYPRFELIEEFRLVSKGRAFHALQLSRFLALYGADKTVVNEVKDEEARTTEAPKHKSEATLFPPILSWLKSTYPNCHISTTIDYFDFTIECATGDIWIADFLIFGDSSSILTSIRHHVENLSQAVHHYGLAGGIFIVVLPGPTTASVLKPRVGSLEALKVTIITGYHDSELNVFVPV